MPEMPQKGHGPNATAEHSYNRHGQDLRRVGLSSQTYHLPQYLLGYNVQYRYNTASTTDKPARTIFFTVYRLHGSHSHRSGPGLCSHYSTENQPQQSYHSLAVSCVAPSITTLGQPQMNALAVENASMIHFSVEITTLRKETRIIHSLTLYPWRDHDDERMSLPKHIHYGVFGLCRSRCWVP